jgi:hypothetical protein
MEEDYFSKTFTHAEKSSVSIIAWQAVTVLFPLSEVNHQHKQTLKRADKRREPRLR